MVFRCLENNKTNKQTNRNAELEKRVNQQSAIINRTITNQQSNKYYAVQSIYRYLLLNALNEFTAL